jgi:pre-rRNA-processing protein TSR4
MDSDSDDAQSVTETPVLLGYAEDEPTEDTVSHLGGTPVSKKELQLFNVLIEYLQTWLHPTSPADARLAKCSVCNNVMSLLLQLNGAISESPHERMFYVYACKSKTCRRKKGSVRIFRGVKVAPQKSAPVVVEETKEEKKPEPELAEKAPKIGTGNFLFNSTLDAKPAGANPFSTSSSRSNPFSSPPSGSNPFSSSSIPANPFSAAPKAVCSEPKPTTEQNTSTENLNKSFADTLKISSSSSSSSSPSTSIAAAEPTFYGPPEPWPNPLPHQYPLSYLDADYEVLEPSTSDLPKNIEQIESSAAGDDLAMSAAAFESSLDKTFQKFADRVGQNPEQVLR